MSDTIIRKYKSTDLLELQTTSVALADKSFKIFWYNKSFKKDIGTGKIKGTSLKSLFNINTPDVNIISDSAKSFVIPLADKNKNIIIIGSHFSPNELNAKVLGELIKRGNDIFIAANSFGEKFID